MSSEKQVVQEGAPVERWAMCFKESDGGWAPLTDTLMHTREAAIFRYVSKGEGTVRPDLYAKQVETGAVVPMRVRVTVLESESHA